MVNNLACFHSSGWKSWNTHYSLISMLTLCGPKSRGEGKSVSKFKSTDQSRQVFLVPGPRAFLPDWCRGTAEGRGHARGGAFQVTRRGVQVHPVNLVGKVKLRLPNLRGVKDSSKQVTEWVDSNPLFPPSLKSWSNSTRICHKLK